MDEDVFMAELGKYKIIRGNDFIRPQSVAESRAPPALLRHASAPSAIGSTLEHKSIHPEISSVGTPVTASTDQSFWDMLDTAVGTSMDKQKKKKFIEALKEVLQVAFMFVTRTHSPRRYRRSEMYPKRLI